MSSLYKDNDNGVDDSNKDAIKYEISVMLDHNGRCEARVTTMHVLSQYLSIQLHI
jgi:hypothetical protein